MKKIKQKKRIKWPRTRLERFQQYGDMGSTERLRFSQTLGDSRGRLQSVASVQSIDHDDLSLAASAHGFYAKHKASSPRWNSNFGEPPLANNEDSWVEWGTLNSVNTLQRSEHHGDPRQVRPSERDTDFRDTEAADEHLDHQDHQDHKQEVASPTSPTNTSRVAFVFDDNPNDMENYYLRDARLNPKKYQPEPLVSSVPNPLDHPGAPRVKSLICAGQEIATFMDMVWPFIGIFHYCLDVGSDIALILEYLIEGLYAWFALTLVFVALPTIAMTVLSLVLWIRNYKVLKEKVSPVQWTMRITSSVFLATPIMRMVDIFYYAWQSRNTTHDWYTRRMFYERMIDEVTENTLVRLFETFLENAPQLVLQLYVITIVGTSKGIVLVLVQVAGLVISWLSMSISLVNFHTVLRASLQPEKARMTWGGKICMFLWRMFTIASRVVALALFASHFHFYVFVFVGGHFLIMFIWIINQDSTYCQLRRRTSTGAMVVNDGQMSEFFFRFVMAVIHVFCFVNLLEGPTRLRYAFYYSVMFAENLTMIILWYTFGGTVTENTWYHGPAVAIVAGGFLIGIIFHVLYYKWFHPNQHNPAYSDRQIPWCRPCGEMSLVNNVGYKDEDSDEEDEEEVYMVKRGTHIEPMSRPATGLSHRELQPGYSGQVYHDDYREMISYEPSQQSLNNSHHIPMQSQRQYNGHAPLHHPLNQRNHDFHPDDTPLPPNLNQQRQNSSSQGRHNNVPQQRQNYGLNRPHQNSHAQKNRKSYLAVGKGRGSGKERQWGQAAQQRQPSHNPKQPTSPSKASVPEQFSTPGRVSTSSTPGRGSKSSTPGKPNSKAPGNDNSRSPQKTLTKTPVQASSSPGKGNYSNAPTRVADNSINPGKDNSRIPEINSNSGATQKDNLATPVQLSSSNSPSDVQSPEKSAEPGNNSTPKQTHVPMQPPTQGQTKSPVPVAHQRQTGNPRPVAGYNRRPTPTKNNAVPYAVSKSTTV